MTVSLHPWSKRDRSAEMRWPQEPVETLLWRLFPRTEGPRKSWAIRLADRTVGRISLRGFEAASARLGMYLAEDVRGQGIGTRALGLFLFAVAFDELALSAVRLDVAATNKRAVRLYQRHGFQVVRDEIREAAGQQVLYLEMERHAASCTSVSGGVGVGAFN